MKHIFRKKFTWIFTLALAALVVIPFAAFADNVVDNVTVGGNDTFTAPGSTIISYKVNANGGDGQTGCNASDGSPVTITLSVPAGVTASTTSLTFNTCGDFQQVTFSSNTAGSYAINVSSISDSGAGAYNNQANWTLHVNGPSDTTPPVISKTITGTSGSNGWYTSNVTVAWTVTDPDSSVVIDSGCGTQNFTSETAGAASSCSAHSAGGSSSDSVTIKLDKTGPSAALAITAGTLGANGWYVSNVTVSTSGSDSISSPVSCTAAQILSTDTAGQTVNGSCTNDAGLTTNATPLIIKLDKTGPSAALAITAGTLGANDWYTSDVTVSTSGSDSVSGPVSCTADQFQTDETTGQAFNGSCTNDAGLTSNAMPLTVKVDKTGPSATLSAAGTLGNNGWYVSDVTVSTNGSDSISDPTTCTPNQSRTTDTTGTAFSGSCTNDAGLSTDAAPLTVKLDKTKPVITISAADESLCASSTSQPSFIATDATSGVASSGGSITSSPSTPSGVGSYTYTATATDYAGNVASDLKTYKVTYGAAFGGFLQPINSDGSSRFKLGSTIPVKFQLTCNGAPISTAVAKLYVAKGDSVADPGVDEAISTSAATVGNLFRWTGSPDNQYIFNLSTKVGYTNPGTNTITSFSPGTWTLKIGLDDGTWRSINVQLPK